MGGVAALIKSLLQCWVVGRGGSGVSLGPFRHVSTHDDPRGAVRNGIFRDTVRCFIKGDAGKKGDFATRTGKAAICTLQTQIRWREHQHQLKSMMKPIETKQLYKINYKTNQLKPIETIRLVLGPAAWGICWPWFEVKVHWKTIVNTNGTPRPGIRLTKHLRYRQGSATASKDLWQLWSFQAQRKKALPFHQLHHCSRRLHP